jgi:predicted ATPase/two-component SAPR family response regulator/GGDEF domain-containing protein
MARLSIYLLGDFQVRLDDQVITRKFRTEKERALLAYLAVESKRSHSRETLSELFWPERPESMSRANLRQALLGVRKALGDQDSSQPFLSITEEGVHLDPQVGFWLDLDAFRTRYIFTLNHAHGSASTCIECAQTLQEAVALYRNDFLDGIYLADGQFFQEWMFFLREQYFRYLLAALDQLGQFFLEMHDYETAQQYAWRHVKQAPVEEVAYRRLMEVMALTGRRSAALEQYQNCRQVLLRELGVEPSPETIALYERIKQDKIAPHDEASDELAAAQLPLQFTAFIGRQEELAQLEADLSSDHSRLLAITGFAGAGKTRLAIELSNRCRSLFADGVWFISAELIRNPELFILALARALGLTVSGSNPRAQLFRFLTLRQTLLVIDHFDHLIAHSDLLLEILRASPKTRIIVTSRLHLDTNSANVFALEGLPFPDQSTTTNILAYPACELFVQRAARRRLGFNLTSGNAAQVAQICRLVEGLPLAIELAAARLNAMTTQEIASSLQHNLSALATSLPDLPEAHRNFSAILEAIWQGLSEEQQNVLVHLSLGSGSHELAAALEIGHTSLALLSTLVQKSLLRSLPVNRYSLLTLLRVFALEKLGKDPERFRHALERFYRYYLSLLDQKLTDLAYPKQRPEAFAVLKDELGNIQQAVDLASTQYDSEQAALAANEFQTLIRLLHEQGENVHELLAHEQMITGSARSAIASVERVAQDASSRFILLLRERMNFAAQNAHPLALMTLDLDIPPAINDQPGILSELEQRLHHSLRSHDQIHRFDAVFHPHYFGLIIDQLTRPSDAEFVAIKVLRSLVEPFGSHAVTGHLGIGLYPVDSDTPEGLLLHTKKNRFCLAEPETGCYILALFETGS